MGKVKYDVSDVEAGTDFDTPVPRGTYRCKITDCKESKSKQDNDMISIEYEIMTGEWKNRKLWDYIVLDDSSAWKLRQFTDALGKRAKGTLDTNAVIGERVLVRAKHETDDRDPDNLVTRARVGSVSALPDTDDDDEPDDDAEEGADDEYTYDDIEGMDKDDLKQVVKDEDLGIRVTSKTKVENLRKKVLDALELEEPSEEDEEEEDEGEPEDSVAAGDEEELTREDLDEYTREDLEELIGEEDIEVDRTKKTRLSVLRQRVWDALTEDEDLDEEEEEGEDEEEEVEYEDMSIADLTAELKARNLSTTTKTKGSRKKKLFIKRLEEDDENGDKPF